jgi:large subunit ribosomal protein L13
MLRFPQLTPPKGSTILLCSTVDLRVEWPVKTYTPKADDIERRWWLVDAKGKTLGRLATRVAGILRGKHKPMFTPHLDVGDYVVVINAEKVALTGRKAEQKTYFTHSGYMGHEKHTPFKKMIETHPDRVVELAVRGMLPKNTLGRHIRKKLKVYAGAAHPHEGQQPQELEV